MTSSSIALIRKQLLKRSRELSRKNGKNSQAVDIWASLEPSEKTELEGVHRALERIGRGIYGSCVDCQTQLDDTVLQSIPVLEHCEGCSTPLAASAEMVA